MVYSAGWQLLEERVWESWTGEPTDDIDKVYQTIYGIRYIDDVICRRLDGDVDGTYDKTWYHLTDNQFSTVAVLDHAANLVERAAYDPCGGARHQWMADLDGDGDQDSTDLNAINTLASGHGTSIDGANYNVDADINRDGLIDSTDYNLANSDGTRSALAKGTLSSSAVENVFGYSGYVFNIELVGGGGAYLVRFRNYDIGLGRWIERDPLGVRRLHEQLRLRDGHAARGDRSERPDEAVVIGVRCLLR